MTWSWWSFAIGLVGSFVVSFGAMVGWWFLLQRNPKRAQRLAELNEFLERQAHERRN